MTYCFAVFCQDLFFVVLWSQEEEQMYDVIHAKDIIPPPEVDVLDVKEETECRAKFQTKIFDVIIIARGTQYIYFCNGRGHIIYVCLLI